MAARPGGLSNYLSHPSSKGPKRFCVTGRRVLSEALWKVEENLDADELDVFAVAGMGPPRISSSGSRSRWIWSIERSKCRAVRQNLRRGITVAAPRPTRFGRKLLQR